MELIWHPLETAPIHLPKVSGVYVIRHIDSGKEYVGLSRNVKRRADSHRACGKVCSLLHRAVLKHGLHSFEMCLLAEVAVADLPAAEVAAIQTRGTQHPAGYNLTGGGGRADVWKRDPERKLELAARNSALHLGRKRSDITKARLSASNKGKKRTAEQIANMSAAQTGKKMPPVTRKAINASIQQRIWVWPPDCMVPLEFESVGEVVAHTGRSRSGLQLILAGKGASRDGTVFAYAEERKGKKPGRQPKQKRPGKLHPASHPHP